MSNSPLKLDYVTFAKSLWPQVTVISKSIKGSSLLSPKLINCKKKSVISSVKNDLITLSKQIVVQTAFDHIQWFFPSNNCCYSPSSWFLLILSDKICDSSVFSLCEKLYCTVYFIIQSCSAAIILLSSSLTLPLLLLLFSFFLNRQPCYTGFITFCINKTFLSYVILK